MQIITIRDNGDNQETITRVQIKPNTRLDCKSINKQTNKSIERKKIPS